MVMRPQDQSEPGPAGGEVDLDHDAYVRAKVQRGLEQSRDRSAMIPIEQVWRDLSR